VQPGISGLAAGTYDATVTVTPSEGPAQTVSVTLVLNPAPTAPATPTNVAAVPGNTSAVVTWTAPSNGGSPITSYLVTPYVGATAQTTTTVTGSPPATSVTVGGLKNGTAYTFTVVATNALGSSPPSNPSAAVTPTQTTAPVVDANVSVDASGTTATTPLFSTAQAGETLVAYVASDGPKTANSQSSTVSGAGLTWKLVARTNTEYGTAEIWSAEASSPLSNVTVSSTESKTGYNQLLAVTSFEDSSGVGASQSADASTGAPTVSLTTTSANSLIYGVGNDWDAAKARTVGSNQALVDQWVDTGSGDTFWVQDQKSAIANGGSAVTLTDTAPTTDRWNMTAVEILGSTPATPTAPAAPTGVSAVAGNQSAVVSWTAPSNGGSPITSYLVTPYVGATAQTTATVTGSPPATSVTVDGLENGTAYTFTVVATNAIGSSPPSNPSAAVTPSVPVGPVKDVDVSVDASGTTATTTAFSTSQPTELLVAFVSADGPNSGGQTATVSGGGLTWTLAARANGQNGAAEIWTAAASSILSNVTVTSTEGKTGYDQSLTVLSFEQSGGVGATSTANAASGAPTISITTTGNESLVLAVGEDWDNATARTVGTGQSLVSQWVDSGQGDTFWVQQVSEPVASPALIMLNDSAPTTDRWNLAAVEVKGT
jgi:hypothetical protein